MRCLEAAILTGQTEQHLQCLGRYKMQPAVATAFCAMQAAAATDGFDLQPASAFRDFARQQCIWNEKFIGKRPVLDAQSQPIDLSELTEQQRCVAILRWSALPGASRHHWGTDLDIYDPTRLPKESKLQLEPWEYESGGYFAELAQWLNQHMAEFDFYLPFAHPQNRVAFEPWHISYRPIAQNYANLFSPSLLISAWENQHVEGKAWLTEHIEQIFHDYVVSQ